MKRVLAGVSIAALLLPYGNAAAAQARSDFESGLRRAVAIKGQPVEHLRLADRMAHYKVPGVSVAIMENCRIVFAKGYGVAKAGGKAITSDTLFQAASISKPVAALGALRLVEEGKLDLDADVGTRLRSWNLPGSSLTHGHPVTLRGLLSHGAGLGVSGFGGYAANAPVPSIVQILNGSAPANSAAVTVTTPPGSEWRYSGGGYTVAQLMMIEATGKSFPALMKKLVLDPAGMTASGYDQPLPAAKAGRAAIAHRGDGSAVPGNWHVYPEMAAAGLWTTPTDLLRFAKAVIAADRGAPDAIISQAMARDMLKRQIGSWGLGPAVSEDGKPREFSHGGANEGFRARLTAFPDTCQGAAVMTNGTNGSDLVGEILRAIADAYHWPNPMASQERDAVALSPAITERFVGTYRLKTSPETRLRIEAGSPGTLVLIEPEGLRYMMVPGSEHALFSPDSDIIAEFDPASAAYRIGFEDEPFDVVRDEK